MWGTERFEQVAAEVAPVAAAAEAAPLVAAAAEAGAPGVVAEVAAQAAARMAVGLQAALEVRLLPALEQVEAFLHRPGPTAASGLVVVPGTAQHPMQAASAALGAALPAAWLPVRHKQQHRRRGMCLLQALGLLRRTCRSWGLQVPALAAVVLPCRKPGMWVPLPV
jgi:hypothetical protein